MIHTQGNRTYSLLLLITIMFFSIAISLVISGCGDDEEPEEDSDKEKKEVDLEIDEDEDEGINLDQIECIYCGQEEGGEYEVFDRPFIFTYGNSSNERPHSGISKACVVYEIRVEGRKTRLLALFNKEIPGDIGNIRSLRLDFIPIIREHDAYYVHVGGHQPALNRIGSLGVANLNEFSHPGFRRADHRGAPYNVYTSIPDLVESADSQGYRDESDREKFLEFRDEENIYGGEQAEKLKLSYGSNFNVVEYEYHEKEGKYARYVDGERYTDIEQDEDIMVSNIIIQFADSRVVDDVGRRDIDIVGSGQGKYVSKGEVIPISWEKESETGETVYYDEDGEPIKLYPGQTWVNIIEENNVSFGEEEEK